MSTFNIYNLYPPHTCYGRFSGEPEPVVVRTVEGAFGDAQSRMWHFFTIDGENRSTISPFSLSNSFQKEAVRLYYDKELTKPSPLSVPNVSSKRARVVESIEGLALDVLSPYRTPFARLPLNLGLRQLQVSA